MNFECCCSLRERLAGDGCDICNTEYAIDTLPTPVEVADELANDAFFTDDQANHIAEEIYQPLLGLIKILNRKIDEMAKQI